MILNSPYISGSLTVTGATVLSGSVTLASGSSIAGTSSLATTALTASSISNLNQNVQVTGSLTVSSAITAQTLVVQTITSSIDYITGSSINGSLMTNTHQVTGSLLVTGSIVQTGANAINSFSGSVGINTTSPSYTLDVTGTLRATGAATFSSSVTAGDFISTSGTGAILRLLGGGTSVQYQKWANDGGNYFIGISSSTGTGLLGGQNAYSFCLVTESARDMSFGTTNTERMRITSAGQIYNSNAPVGDWGMRVFGNSTAGNSYGFKVLGGTNSSDVSMLVTDYTGGTAYLRIRGDGYMSSVPTYNNTYSNAANVYIGSDGFMGRSTSSIKYKENVLDYSKGLAEVLQLRPVSYTSKNPNEEGQTFAGLIAEEIHELGLTEFVQYAEDGSPDALAYQNMVALLVKGMQEQNQLIESLKSRIEVLESK